MVTLLYRTLQLTLSDMIGYGNSVHEGRLQQLCIRNWG